jgi:hypothetical protein
MPSFFTEIVPSTPFIIPWRGIHATTYFLHLPPNYVFISLSINMRHARLRKRVRVNVYHE